MPSLKFEGRPTNVFLAAVNPMFGGSSQLATQTAEHCFVVWTMHNDLITARSAVIGSWEEPMSIWLTVAENAFVGWALNFSVRIWVRILLKGAVTDHNFTLNIRIADIVLQKWKLQSTMTRHHVFCRLSTHLVKLIKLQNSSLVILDNQTRSWLRYMKLQLIHAILIVERPT